MHPKKSYFLWNATKNIFLKKLFIFSSNDLQKWLREKFECQKLGQGREETGFSYKNMDKPIAWGIWTSKDWTIFRQKRGVTEPTIFGDHGKIWNKEDQVTQDFGWRWRMSLPDLGRRRRGNYNSCHDWEENKWKFDVVEHSTDAGGQQGLGRSRKEVDHLLHRFSSKPCLLHILHLT